MFGGMSGVVYGLLGMCGLNPDLIQVTDYILIKNSFIYARMVFSLFCRMYLPGVANWAHAGGLVTGAVWGYISAVRWNR